MQAKISDKEDKMILDIKLVKMNMINFNCMYL